MKFETVIKKAKSLEKYGEELAATEHWGVDDQDTLSWLVDRAIACSQLVERLEEEIIQLRSRQDAFDQWEPQWGECADRIQRVIDEAKQ